MPTVLWIGKLRVVVYPNDHRPAHVHVIGQGHESVWELNRGLRAVTRRENYGFPARVLARIARALEANRTDLLAAWERIHGAN